MEIGRAISSLEDRNEAGVMGGVWVSDVDHLYIHLETLMGLVPSQLHLHFIGWDGGVVPSEATSTPN